MKDSRSTRQNNKESPRLLDMEEEGKEIVFWNKCDLGEDSKWGI
jgi:hypothetical protein